MIIQQTTKRKKIISSQMAVLQNYITTIL